MKALLLSVLLAAMPVAVFAQETSSEPPRRPSGRYFGGEAEDASQFMQEYSPNRWMLVQSLPEEGAVRRGVMNFMVARYRSLMAIKDDDPELFQIKIDQLKAEDEVYGIVGPSRSVEERQNERAQIESAVRRMVELNVAEREHRIERLKKSLVSEEEKLAADRKRMETAVKNRVEALVAEGASGLRRDFFPAGRMAPRHERPATQPTESR